MLHKIANNHLGSQHLSSIIGNQATIQHTLNNDMHPIQRHLRIADKKITSVDELMEMIDQTNPILMKNREYMLLCLEDMIETPVPFSFINIDELLIYADSIVSHIMNFADIIGTGKYNKGPANTFVTNVNAHQSTLDPLKNINKLNCWTSLVKAAENIAPENEIMGYCATNEDNILNLMAKASKYKVEGQTDDQICTFVSTIPMGYIISIDLGGDYSRNGHVFLCTGSGTASEFDDDSKGNFMIIDIIKRYKKKGIVKKLWYTRPPWLNKS